MKKSIKCGITAAVVAVASFAAYQSSDSYGVQDNSLLMQNIEALAQTSDEQADSFWDKLVSDCFQAFSTMKPEPCMTSQTTASTNTNMGIGIDFPIEGVPIGFNISGGSSSYTTTNYSGKDKLVCVRDWTTSFCDRREQTDCNGNKLGSAACHN